VKVVIQRVLNASVTVDSKIISNINKGLLVLTGVSKDDVFKDADYLIEKILNLRIFEDNKGKMNLSLLDIKGEILIVSQFTLLGDTRKGRRPSFDKAAKPDKAIEIYNYFIEQIKLKGINTSSGIFGAMMDISLVNNGPVTFIIDSKQS